MAVPATTVEAYFDLSATGGTFWRLEDPIQGALDQVLYPIAGDIAQDISDFVLGATVSRGRSRQFDQMQVGTAQLRIRNDARTFDPAYVGSPYVGNIRPGKQVVLSALGVPYYTGKITEWAYDYQVDGVSTANATCWDALGDLGAVSMIGWTATAGQSSGDRVAAVLDRPEVNYPANRALTDGAATLQGDVIDDGTNVLAYLQLVTDSEFGRLFASRTNVVTFQGRTTNANASAVALADADPDIRFAGVTISFATELLYNQTIISRVGGSTETFTDTESVDDYGPQTLTRTDLLYDTDQQSYDAGLFLLGIYADPEQRFSTVSVNLARCTQAQQTTLLALDLGDLLTITYTPDGIGLPVVDDCVIEGIQHTVSPGTHLIVYSLGTATARGLWCLEDPMWGSIDGPGVIGF